MKIYNTLTKSKEEFLPQEKNKVKMYVCGITPYDKSHLGHARTLVAFDNIRRYFEFRGFDVAYVQNVTDIDDKIINRAKEMGLLPLEVASLFNSQSEREFEILGIKKPNASPRVSQYIPQIIELIGKIMQNGYAYVTSSGVYFDVMKFRGYGALSGQNMDEIRAGARIEIDEEKKNPQDFALWKFGLEEGATFDSPWGKGRPGWHIECSAMSMCTLGETIDIHGGARDLIFPHHENEIAQSESATGKKFVRYWMHTGFLTVNGEKMAKSLGNFVTIEDALSEFSPKAIRMFFTLTHYRSPIDFSRQAIAAAANSLQTIYDAIEAAKSYPLPAVGNARLSEEANLAEKEFIAHMDDDFDTPNAMAALFALARKVSAACSESDAGKMDALSAAATLEKLLAIFSLEPTQEGLPLPKEEIERLIKERDDARKRKDFARADMIRKQLQQQGIVLEDRKDGTTAWRAAKRV
ncbi:MAG: cysteine--tRNA ligase [Candidatus Micrarchaeota archaeon]|nr:cysteine--tRNA ligase [Candidatus Micrarchaeota archaeon]